MAQVLDLPVPAITRAELQPIVAQILGRSHVDITEWRVWLEDVAATSKCWTPAHFDTAACHLGQFNGPYLAGQPLPLAIGTAMRILVSMNLLGTPEGVAFTEAVIGYKLADYLAQWATLQPSCWTWATKPCSWRKNWTRPLFLLAGDTTMQQFRDKVAVITGAGRGIGRGIAARCAREGMKVVLAGIGLESLARTEADLRDQGATVLCVQTDVTKVADIERLAEKTLACLWGGASARQQRRRRRRHHRLGKHPGRLGVDVRRQSVGRHLWRQGLHAHHDCAEHGVSHCQCIIRGRLVGRPRTGHLQSCQARGRFALRDPLL